MKVILTFILYVLMALGSPQDRFLEAVALYSEGKVEAAEPILRELAAGESPSDAVYYYLGLCDLRKNDLSEAELFLREAVKADSLNYYYRESLAEVLAAKGDMEATISVYEGLLRDFPKKIDIQYTLLSLYGRTGRADKLLSTMDDIETVTGRDERLALARYDVLMRLGRQDEAYQALVDYNNDFSSAEVLCAMGEYRSAKGEDSLAMALFDEALATDGSSVPAYLGKAELYRVDGRDSLYFNTLGTFAARKDIPTEMKAQYFARLMSVADPAYISSCRTQFSDVLSAAVASDSSSIMLTAAYVQMLLTLKDWNSLLDVCEDAFERFPGETAFLRYRCAAFYKLEDTPSFIAENRRIIDAAPSDTTAVLEAWLSIGDSYYLGGEERKAYRAYENALKLDDSYVPVLNNYAYFLACRGRKLKRALTMSEKTIKAEPDNATYLDTYGWILYLLKRPAEAKPVFKHAMLYGGKDSRETLYHYSKVLEALGEYDLAKVYSNLAEKK